MSVLPGIAGHVYQDRLHDHRSCIGSNTLGRAFMTTGYFAYTPFADRSYVEFTMTCAGFCALRQPVLQVSAVPFELHLTTRPPLTRTAVYPACLVIPAKGRSHLDSAHRRPHAYLNIVNTIGATSIVADIACGRRRVHGIHCLRYLVRIFFSAERRALFTLRLCSRLSSIPAVPSSSEESAIRVNQYRPQCPLKR